LLELLGCQLSVTTVETCLGGERQAKPDQKRGKCAPDHPETGVPFADVVEEGCSKNCKVPFSGVVHDRGRVISVSLIRGRLGEEDPGLGGGEPSSHCCRLRRTQWLGRENVEESAGEVPQ
jgi:hypothetical protein